MTRININGVDIIGGRNITIINGKVTVDGKDVTPDGKAITIQVEGNVDTLSVDACQTVTIDGSAGSVQSASGDITIGGDVTGGVQTASGDVSCSIVSGDVITASGDIDAISINGSVSTMTGDIRYRK